MGVLKKLTGNRWPPPADCRMLGRSFYSSSPFQAYVPASEVVADERLELRTPKSGSLYKPMEAGTGVDDGVRQRIAEEKGE
jgi:hypothetical protein